MLIEKKSFQEQKEDIRKLLLKYTRKAFGMLPSMNEPRILDIGCGSGIPTLELATLSGGEVIGIDIDQSALDKFARTIKQRGLNKRVKAIKSSIFDMDFPEGTFDIIWSEGSIYAIGFERGLKEWKRFLKPGGFMIIHDEQGNINEKLEQISNCGYQLLRSFLLSEDVWRNEYFIPLDKLIAETQINKDNDIEILEALRVARDEINMFNNNPRRNSSIFFVMKRK
jgi:SAM-dependent methyltransferase